MLRPARFLLAATLLLAALPAFAQGDLTRLLRYPDIEGDRIAFVYAGDIWVVESAGGTARRLTSHPGLELFPKFSPDGKWIAFVGDYSGSRQVHVISADGGEPRQLTFYNDVGPLPPRGGIDNRVLDWTPDGADVLFLPHRLPWSDRMGAPYVIAAKGGMERPLRITEGGGGMYSPDGTKIVYTPIEREFRTWKRYRGGRAQDVWIYDLKSDTAEQITDFVGTDNQPVWVGDTIYFTSDRERTLDLWAYDTGTRATHRVARHEGWDILWPSAGRSQIVYEAGGYIYRFDPATAQSTRVPIRVYGDSGNALPHFRNVRANIASIGLSPTGARALVGARGEVFTLPAKEGEIRNLTQTPGVRETDPTWSADGRWVAYLSDRTGEYEIWVRRADGGGEERQVTKDGKIWRYPPRWSPDGKRLAFADRNAELHWADAASGATHRIDRGTLGDITDYRWSPDSQWLAYSKAGANQLASIWVHSLRDGKTQRLTDGSTNDYEPVFDPDGRYLYFLSNRDFTPTFSGFEFDFVYTDPTRVYVGVLAEDGPALFLPQSDEEKSGEESAAETKAEAAAAGEEQTPAKAEADAAKEDKGKAKPGPAPKVRIDPGFERRVRAIPGKPGDYRALGAVKKGVLYLKGAGPETKLWLYDLEKKEEKTVLAGIQGYELSGDGKKLLFSKGAGAERVLGVAAPEPDQKNTEGLLELGRLETKVEPRAEWQQEFVDGWRTLRDWFYDSGMHGVDWPAMRAKYEPLVAHIGHRTDLDFILGEMGSELNSGHMYIQTSSEWQGKRADNGLLGAVIEPHPSGVFRIAKIFAGENWHEDFRSPLTEPGVRVREGDYILAVDGVSAHGVDNFYRLLENKANRAVTLLVNGRPDRTGAHEERVRPIKRETNLRYLDWIHSRRALVEQASNGRIGYIHLPNTGAEGSRELFKTFYPQADKEALIIDVRYNGGGFIPSHMIELLGRPALSYWARRGVEPFSTPGFVHRGPKVALINGYSSSGGDAFPWYFRKQGMGKLIGTRTWGGLIGLSGNPDLMDGGSVLVPTFRFLDPDGSWEVENQGVSPDIEVLDRPDLVARGQDPTLEKGIAVLLEELARNPVNKLVVPSPPVEVRAPGEED